MRIDDLTFSYGDKKIFDDFSLEIPDNGITALSGPSGCGKTTLLRLIAGIEKPGSGVINAPDPEKIAFLFQEDRLLPGISAIRQLEIAVPGCDARKWLKSVELEGEEKTVPEELSGGMKRRLSLARCLAYAEDKELILLDEPFAGIDAARIGKLTELIKGMRIPVIVTSHTKEAMEMADRVVELLH